MADVLNIAGRIHSISEEGVSTTADEILDESANKKQNVINQEVSSELATHESRLNALTSQNYVTVTATSTTTAVTDVLPAEGAMDTVYRVGKWNGSQYNANVYSEYAWTGVNYMLLDVKEYGIDDEPVAGSENLVKSGGIAKLLVNNHFIGNNSTFVSVPLKGLIPSVSYQIALQNPTWDNTGCVPSYSSGAGFQIFYYKNGTQTTIVNVWIENIPTNTRREFNFVMPSDADNNLLYVGGRAIKGEVIRFSVIPLGKLDEKVTQNSENLISSGAIYDSVGPYVDTYPPVAFKKVLLPAGQSHSSNLDRFITRISTGQKYLVKSNYHGPIYVRYGEGTQSVSVGNTNTILIAESDITSIGVYYSSSQQDRVIELSLYLNDALSLNESVDALNESVGALNKAIDVSTENPVPINIKGRNAILTGLTLYKGVKYKLIIDITYDISRAAYLQIGVYEGTVSSLVQVEWERGVNISPATTHLETWFIPQKTVSGNGIFGISNYNYDSANIQYGSVHITSLNVLQKIRQLEDEIDDIVTEEDDFLKRTSAQMKQVRQLGYARRSGGMPANYIPQLSFIHISDTHGYTGNEANAVNAIEALNALSTGTINNGNFVKFLIHTGDIKQHNFVSSFDYWINARSAATKPVFHVAGNHDVGFNNGIAGAGTDEQVYEVLVAPFLTEWGLKTDGDGTPHPDGKNYYFTDFTDEKVRLIVLYEYETDWTVDPNDNTKFLYYRDYRAFHQAQIDWFINTLLTTPAGYGVIIAKHQMEGFNDGDVNSFNCPMKKDISGQSQSYVPKDMIADIVNAFRRGIAITESYSQTGNCLPSTPTLVVNADFSNKNAGAEFICYLSGHTHCDEIHYVKKYPDQLELTIACDNVTYTDGSDMNQIRNTLSQDVINVCAVDRNLGLVNVIRIGSNLSNTMQKRDVLSLPYRNI